jgi:hypothetical protein
MIGLGMVMSTRPTLMALVVGVQSAFGTDLLERQIRIKIIVRQCANLMGILLAVWLMEHQPETAYRTVSILNSVLYLVEFICTFHVGSRQDPSAIILRHNQDGYLQDRILGPPTARSVTQEEIPRLSRNHLRDSRRLVVAHLLSLLFNMFLYMIIEHDLLAYLYAYFPPGPSIFDSITVVVVHTLIALIAAVVILPDLSPIHHRMFILLMAGVLVIMAAVWTFSNGMKNVFLALLILGMTINGYIGELPYRSAYEYTRSHARANVHSIELSVVALWTGEAMGILTFLYLSPPPQRDGGLLFFLLAMCTLLGMWMWSKTFSRAKEVATVNPVDV